MTRSKRRNPNRQRPDHIGPRIERAVKMLVTGATWPNTADHLMIGVEGLKEWRRSHRQFWETQWAAALEIAYPELFSPGFEEKYSAVIQPEDAWLLNTRIVGRGVRFRRGLRLRGQEPASHWTLSDFFFAYVLPEVVYPKKVKDTTKQSMIQAVDHWSMSTGNPTLEELGRDPSYSKRFREYLEQRDGRAAELLSPTTVRSRVKEINQILKLAGPLDGEASPVPYLFGYKCVLVRDGDRRGEFWQRRPRPQINQPPKPPTEAKAPLTAEEFSKLIQAARQETSPLIHGIPAGDFWVAFYTFNRNVGVRFTENFALTWSMIDGDLLKTPAEIEKGKRPGVYFVNPAAKAAIESIRTRNPQIFPFPNKLRDAFRIQRRIFLRAGIYRWGFGSHANRRWLGTTLIDAGHELAAQRQLGHRSLTTTLGHYSDRSAGLRRAFDAIEETT